MMWEMVLGYIFIGTVILWIIATILEHVLDIKLQEQFKGE